jgi:hypothetical protein
MPFGREFVRNYTGTIAVFLAMAVVVAFGIAAQAAPSVAMAVG